MLQDRLDARQGPCASEAVRCLLKAVALACLVAGVGVCQSSSPVMRAIAR